MLSEILSGLDMGSDFSRIQRDFNEDIHKRGFALINLLQLSHISPVTSAGSRRSLCTGCPLPKIIAGLFTHINYPVLSQFLQVTCHTV